jgi:Mn2+/Fe2+ NRAMP family transporter
MIQLPFALLPMLTFVSHPRVMFDFRAERRTQLVALLISVLVIFINLYFSGDYIIGELGSQNWFFFMN